MKGSSKVQSNSKTVSINLPKDIVEAMKISKGDMVILEVLEDGTLIVKK
jgi:antitoxin component of MazEF toxin-antitoxin module